MLRSRALCRLLRSLPSGCSGSAGEGLLGQFPTHLACVSSDEGPSTSYASSNSSAAGWAAVSGRRWLSAGMPQGFAAAQATKDSSSAPSESSPASSASGLPGPGPISSKPRFYKTVKVLPAPEGQGWVLHLDGRPVKTPGKHLLVAPTKALALALAAEWEWQPKGKPQMLSMPLMSIAVTAIDQPKPREKVIDSLLRYVGTDATCCRYEPGSRAAEQQAVLHDPLLAWARKELGWSLQASDSIFGPQQSDEAITKVRTWIEGLDPWRLAAMESLTFACKSVVIAAAVLRGSLGIKGALRAARVEEDVQVEAWGEVEAGHDLDVADIGSRIAAPAVLVRLLQQPGAGASGGTAGSKGGVLG